MRYRRRQLDQVGCVYTAQGLSLRGTASSSDRSSCGAPILGRTRQYNPAPDLRSSKTVDDATVDRLVRHVYKVLKTRGMVGTLLYSTDEETREKLGELVTPR